MTVHFNLDKKVIAIIVLSALLVVSGVFIYSKVKQNQMLTALNSQKTQDLLKANLDLGKAETKIGDASKQLSQMDTSVKKYISDYNLAVTEAGMWKGQAEFFRNNASGKPITINVPPGTPGSTTIINPEGKPSTTTTVENMKDRIYIDDNMDGKPDRKLDDLIVSYEDFHLTVKADAIKNLWDYKLNQTFQGKMVRTIDKKTGLPQQFVEIWELDDKGKEVNKMKIIDFQIVASPEPKSVPKFFKSNPKLDIGVNVSMNQRLNSNVNAELGMSFMSYGPSKNESAWKFLRLGISDGLGVSLTPFEYNVGKKIPYIQDLFVGPSVSYKKGDVYYGIMISNPF